jgi:lysophospholipase L1-like esterase
VTRKPSTAGDAEGAEGFHDVAPRPLRPQRWRVGVLLALFALAHLHAQEKGPILFVGSSILHRWTQLQPQMAPLPVQNIAFDGAVTDDWNRMVEFRVAPLKPRVVVYYCGSNDVDLGDSAAAIVHRVRVFIDRVAKALPGTPVVFISVIRAPEKRDRWDVVDDINGQLRKLAVRNPHVQFVDINPALENSDASPRMEFFMNDQLHLRPAAYEELARTLKPFLEGLLRRP